jgi:hypothetical protein
VGRNRGGATRSRAGTLAGRRRAPVVTAPPAPAPLPVPPPIPTDSLQGDLAQLEMRLRGSRVPLAEQARAQSASVADFVQKLAPLVGVGQPTPFKGITNATPPVLSAWDNAQGMMQARGAWNLATGEVHLHPEVQQHLADYVRTGKLNTNRYLAIQTVIHELQHVQSRPLNRRGYWEYDPNVEEGMVEWRSRRLANAALFGNRTVPPEILNKRAPSYGAQHDAIDVVARSVGDAQMETIWNARTADRRRRLLAAATRRLSATDQRIVAAGIP